MMQSLSSTVVLNAMPTMARALHEDLLRMNLLITVFMLSATLFVPLTGWLADRIGARRLLEWAMILFAAASAACGLARDLDQMLAARAVQGLAGAVLMTMARVIVVRALPRHEVAAGLALVTVPSTLGPLVGPVIGGFFVTYGDWRWIFYMNLPLAALAVTLIRVYVPRVPPEETPTPLDWFGTLLSGVWMTCFILLSGALSDSRHPPLALISLLLMGVTFLGLYVLHARRSPHPVLDFRLFRLPTFSITVLAGGVIRFGLQVNPFLLAMLLQVCLGATAFVAGMLTFLAAIGGVIVRIVSPPLLHRFGFRSVLLASTTISGLTILSCAAFEPSTPMLLIAAVLTASGVFQALHFTAITTLTFAELAPQQISSGSTTSAMINQLIQATSIGLAAGLLRLIMHLRGDTEVTLGAVAPGFVVAAGLILGATPVLATLARNAGQDMHTPKSQS